MCLVHPLSTYDIVGLWADRYSSRSSYRYIYRYRSLLIGNAFRFLIYLCEIEIETEIKCSKTNSCDPQRSTAPGASVGSSGDHVDSISKYLFKLFTYLGIHGDGAQLEIHLYLMLCRRTNWSASLMHCIAIAVSFSDSVSLPSLPSLLQHVPQIY